MNLEQQYRTGRFAQVDPVPVSLAEQVADALERIADDTDFLAVLPPLLSQQCSGQEERAAAKRTLSLTGTPDTSLLRHTQALVAADPAHEAAYWEAMWILRTPAAADSEYRLYLPRFADHLESLMQYREAGWPTTWHPYLCDLWQTHGGTPATARAWARAGWSADAALLAQVPSKGQLMTLAERLACLMPPLAMPAPTTGASSSPLTQALSPQGGLR